MTTTAERVDRAFQRVPRADFLPVAVRAWAGVDSPLQLTDGQTSSQPSTVRAMLMLLDVRSGHRVLDVGSGSGWTTALLAALAGPAGSVDGVEVRPDLADWGAANLTASGWGHARIHLAGRELGWPPGAPYDRVLVSADAPEVPEELTAQLADGGRLVLPVRGTMTVVERSAGRAKIVRTAGEYMFVPLVLGD